MTYKLIHSETKIITLIENTGTTGTIYTIFTGTWDECRDEAIRLQLTNINEFFPIPGNTENINTPSYTVDEWLTYQGFTAIKLIALIDIESKIRSIATGLKESLDKLYGELSSFQYNVETIISGVNQEGKILSVPEFRFIVSDSRSNIENMRSHLDSLITSIRHPDD